MKNFFPILSKLAQVYLYLISIGKRLVLKNLNVSLVDNQWEVIVNEQNTIKFFRANRGSFAV